MIIINNKKERIYYKMNKKFLFIFIIIIIFIIGTITFIFLQKNDYSNCMLIKAEKTYYKVNKYGNSKK